MSAPRAVGPIPGGRLALWFLLPIAAGAGCGVVAYPFVFNVVDLADQLEHVPLPHPQFRAGPTRSQLRPSSLPRSRNFYRIFGKTFAWTAINLVFHFTLGLSARRCC